MTANLVLTWRIFINKRMVFWPAAVIPLAYYAYVPIFLQKHSKKLFDMCNLGEDFYLGTKRHQVLLQCNQILDVEDF